jgi:hypothetical protein
MMAVLLPNATGAWLKQLDVASGLPSTVLPPGSRVAGQITVIRRGSAKSC